MFGWDGQLTSQQAAEIAAAKRVIYDAFVARSGGCAKAEGRIHLDIMDGHFVPNYPWVRRSYSPSDASLVAHQLLEEGECEIVWPITGGNLNAGSRCPS